MRVEGHDAVLIDDGLATGASMLAAAPPSVPEYHCVWTAQEREVPKDKQDANLCWAEENIFGEAHAICRDTPYRISASTEPILPCNLIFTFQTNITL
jgi:hypothetical protein